MLSSSCCSVDVFTTSLYCSRVSNSVFGPNDEQPAITIAVGRTPRRREVRSTLTGRVAQRVMDVVQMILHARQPRGELSDLDFRFPVDGEVELAAEPVLRVLAVLAHHDDGRLDGGEHREEQVQQ